MFSFLNKNYRAEITQIMEKLSSDNIKKLYKYSEMLNKIQENTEQKHKRSCNHRLHETPVWEYMTKDILEKHKKITEESTKTPYYDIIYRSRYNDIKIIGEYNYIDIFGKNNHKVVMADYLMFNPHFKLDYNMLDRLLPYCKIKVLGDYTYKVDGWIISFNIYGNPAYKISYDNSDYDELDFIKTEEEKHMAIRLFIQVMNETPDEYLNFNNYNVIAEWEYHNDTLLKSYKSNMYLLDVYKENKKTESDPSNVLTKNDLVLQVDDLMTKEEIMNLLECVAKNGKNDLCEIGLSKQYKNTNQDINEYMTIDTSRIDLTEYYKRNGYSRTKSVMDNINRELVRKINLKNYIKENGEQISKAELFAGLYNSCTAFGMGVFQNDDKALTVEKADEILKQCRDYIDYYNGVAMKMSFSQYPIIDFERFDKRNGQGKFIECLKKIQGNDKSVKEKTKTTREHIMGEFTRMFLESKSLLDKESRK